MTIRTFDESDAPAVIELWSAALPGTRPHHDPARSIEQKLAVDRDLFLVATDDEGHVIGTVMGGYDGHRGWIYSVAVAPSHRRRGIGTGLVRQVEAALVARGCLKVNLQVLPANAGVVEFYRKLCFAVEERISMGKLLYDCETTG